MNDKKWKLFYMICLGAGIVLAVFDLRWAAGFVIGCAGAALTYVRTEKFCDSALRRRESAGTMGSFMINYLIWAGLLIVCAVLPEYLNILTCAAGLSMVKLVLILTTLIPGME